jgi:hypothetical protein
MKVEECKHKNSYRFHHIAPLYCDDCERYLEYQNNGKGEYTLQLLKQEI